MQGVSGTEIGGWCGAGVHQYKGREPGGVFRGVSGLYEVHHGNDG